MIMPQKKGKQKEARTNTCLKGKVWKESLPKNIGHVPPKTIPIKAIQCRRKPSEINITIYQSLL